MPGLALELATSLYPSHFLVLAGAGNFTKALGKGMGRPVFRVIQTHFAAADNVGAVRPPRTRRAVTMGSVVAAPPARAPAAPSPPLPAAMRCAVPPGQPLCARCLPPARALLAPGEIMSHEGVLSLVWAPRVAAPRRWQPRRRCGRSQGSWQAMHAAWRCSRHWNAAVGLLGVQRAPGMAAAAVQLQLLAHQP